MRKLKKICVLLLTVALILTGVQSQPTTQVSAAKKKMKLSKKNLTLKVGEKKTLKVKNKKGKVTWKTSKKKVATVSKKGVVKAKKAGNATITATVKYKKKKTPLKCKVKVVKKGKQTKAPTKKPATPTPGKTSTKKPATPTPGKIPSGIDTSKATEWDTEKQGGFFVSGIKFTDKSLTYQITDEDDVILVDLGEKASVKEAVSDLSKCTFEVYAAGKNYSEVTVGDIAWSSKSYHPNNMGHGHYTFKLYIVSGGKVYYRTYKMAEKLKTIKDDGRNFTLTGIKSGGKELSPSKDRTNAMHYMLELTGAASVKALIPDLEKATYTASYMGKQVTVEKVKDIQWISYSYYDDYEEGTGHYYFTVVAKNGAQQIEIPLVLSDFNENLAVEEYSYKVGSEDRKALVRDFAQVLTLPVEKGKTIKELWPNMAEAFTFTCLYHDKLYNNVKPTQVEWKTTPYWDDESDGGYYTFTLAVTADGGKQVKRDFYLVEEHRTTSYTVSGTLKSGAGELVEGAFLSFGTGDEEDEEYDYQAITGAGGAYTLDLPEGEYGVWWNRVKVDTVTVGKEPLTHNINATNMFKYSGTLTRLGKAWADCDIEFGGDVRIYAHTDATGAYSVYLPRHEYGFYVFADDAYVERIDTERITDNVTKNIDSDFVRVSGTISQSNNEPVANTEFRAYAPGRWDGEGYEFSTDEDGKYKIYVEKDCEMTIKDLSYSEIGKVTIADSDVVKNITLEVTHITGVLTAMNGDGLSERCIYFLDDEENELGVAETDEEGRYSVYLKPGTYTPAVWSGMYAKCSQKITVGAANAVCNLKAPLYKVSGKVKNYSEPWSDKELLLWWEGEDEEWGGLRIYTDDEGNYLTYAPLKTYTVHADGFSLESGVELKVTGDMTKDICFTFNQVKGHIYRTDGKEFEPDSNMMLKIVDPDGEELEDYIYPDDSSEYCLYVDKQGTYSVRYNPAGQWEEVDTFTVSEAETEHDIICNLYRISGAVTNLRGKNPKQSLYFEMQDGQERRIPVCADEVENGEMPYFVYLPAGTYSAYLENDGEKDKKTVQVTGDMTFDIAAKATYRISGILSRFSKAWAGQSVQFSPVGDSVDYETSDSGDTTSGADGSYEVFLRPGKYAISVNNSPVMEDENTQVVLELTDKDIEKDITMDCVEISGTLKRNGSPVKYEWLEFRSEDGSSQSAYTDEEGRYRITVEPSSTYEVCFSGEVIDTIQVGQEDIAGKNFSVNIVQVLGRVTDESGNAVSGKSIYFYKEGEDNWVANAQTDWAWDDEPRSGGNYQAYLFPGTYDVKIGKENEETGEQEMTTIFENLVVGNDDMTKDIVISQ